MEELTSEENNEIYTDDSNFNDSLVDTLSSENSDNYDNHGLDQERGQDNSQTINMESDILEDEIPQLDDGTIADLVVEKILESVEQEQDSESQEEEVTLQDIYDRLEYFISVNSGGFNDLSTRAENIQLYTGCVCALLAFVLGGFVAYCFIGRIS